MPQVKWAVSLVIAYMTTLIFLRGLCAHVWIGQHTYLVIPEGLFLKKLDNMLLNRQPTRLLLLNCFKVQAIQYGKLFRAGSYSNGAKNHGYRFTL